MASSADVHVRICAQEIIKYDLEIKAAIQVTTRSSIVNYLVLASVVFFRYLRNETTENCSKV